MKDHRTSSPKLVEPHTQAGAGDTDTCAQSRSFSIIILAINSICCQNPLGVDASLVVRMLVRADLTWRMGPGGSVYVLRAFEAFTKAWLRRLVRVASVRRSPPGGNRVHADDPLLTGEGVDDDDDGRSGSSRSLVGEKAGLGATTTRAECPSALGASGCNARNGLTNGDAFTEAP